MDESTVMDAPKTLVELKAAEEEFSTRRWYLTSVQIGFEDASVYQARSYAERRFPVVADDVAALNQSPQYHQGWLDGVDQALRWALGDGERVEDANLDT